MCKIACFTNDTGLNDVLVVNKNTFIPINVFYLHYKYNTTTERDMSICLMRLLKR